MWYQTDYTGLILHPHQRHPDRPYTKCPSEGFSPPSMLPRALSHSLTTRDPSPGLWPLAVASPEQKPEGGGEVHTRTWHFAGGTPSKTPQTVQLWYVGDHRIPSSQEPPPHLLPRLGPSHEPHPLPFLHSAQQRDRYSVWLPGPGLPPKSVTPGGWGSQGYPLPSPLADARVGALSNSLHIPPVFLALSGHPLRTASLVWESDPPPFSLSLRERIFLCLRAGP